MIESPFKEITKFDWKDLHGKFGVFMWLEPTDSDLQESQFMKQLWFRDKEMNLYLVHEE